MPAASPPRYGAAMPAVHLFVCDNDRLTGSRPACSERGRAAAQAILEAVLTRGAGGRIAVTRCACLGRCFDGPIAVEYPRGRWWSGLDRADAAAVAAALDGEALSPALADHVIDIDDD